jgi:hypothetical protein
MRKPERTYIFKLTRKKSPYAVFFTKHKKLNWLILLGLWFKLGFWLFKITGLSIIVLLLPLCSFTFQIERKYKNSLLSQWSMNKKYIRKMHDLWVLTTNKFNKFRPDICRNSNRTIVFVKPHRCGPSFQNRLSSNLPNINKYFQWR